MTAPLKTIDGSGEIAAAMSDIGQRAKAAARVLALARRSRRTARSAAWRRRSAPAKAEILAANAEDVADGKNRGPAARGARPA